MNGSIKSFLRSIMFASLAIALTGAMAWMVIDSTTPFGDPEQQFAQTSAYSQLLALRHLSA
jgi:hypothetical protein